MADRFIPLREFVVPRREAETQCVEAPVASPEVELLADSREASAEVRRFRAAVRDAVDVTVREVLCDVAADVLARELRLAPADIDAIVTRACARSASEAVVRVRVHPDDVLRLERANVDVVPDPDLRRGDAMLDVCSGTIDLSLGARLSEILETVAP